MRAGIGWGFTTFPYLLRIKMPLDRLYVELWNFYICRFLDTAHRQNKYLSVSRFWIFECFTRASIHSVRTMCRVHA